jgi:hypothetical protein
LDRFGLGACADDGGLIHAQAAGEKGRMLLYGRPEMDRRAVWSLAVIPLICRAKTDGAPAPKLRTAAMRNSDNVAVMRAGSSTSTKVSA